MEKLKPCPFCGGEVSIALTGCVTTNWFFITRGHSKDKPNCKCRVFMNSERYFIDCMDTKEAQERARKDLIKAWNTRAGDSYEVIIDKEVLATIKPFELKKTIGVEERGEP